MSPSLSGPPPPLLPLPEACCASLPGASGLATGAVPAPLLGPAALPLATPPMAADSAAAAEVSGDRRAPKPRDAGAPPALAGAACSGVTPAEAPRREGVAARLDWRRSAATALCAQPRLSLARRWCEYISVYAICGHACVPPTYSALYVHICTVFCAEHQTAQSICTICTKRSLCALLQPPPLLHDPSSASAHLLAGQLGLALCKFGAAPLQLRLPAEYGKHTD